MCACYIVLVLDVEQENLRGFKNSSGSCCLRVGVGVLVPSPAEACTAQPFPFLTCYLGRKAELLPDGLKPASPIGKKLKF